MAGTQLDVGSSPTTTTIFGTFMLDGTKFHVTVEHDELHFLDDVLNLFKKIHHPTHNFFFHPTSADKICVKACHVDYKDKEHYPLDVLLPMIKYKASALPEIRDPYIGGDGSSIKAFEVFVDYHGLNIKRVYLYAGK